MRMASLTSTSLSPGFPVCASVSPVLRSNANTSRMRRPRADLADYWPFGRLCHQSPRELGGSYWASKRDLIRTLVKRVEVAQDQVNIVFRIDPYLGDPDLEKSLQLCRGVSTPPLWRACFRGHEYAVVDHSRFEPLPDGSSEVWAGVNLFQEGFLIDAIKTARYLHQAHIAVCA